MTAPQRHMRDVAKLLAHLRMQRISGLSAKLSKGSAILTFEPTGPEPIAPLVFDAKNDAFAKDDWMKWATSVYRLAPQLPQVAS